MSVIIRTWISEAAAGIWRLKCFCLCFCCTFRANPDPKIPCNRSYTVTGQRKTFFYVFSELSRAFQIIQNLQQTANLEKTCILSASRATLHKARGLNKEYVCVISNLQISLMNIHCKQCSQYMLCLSEIMLRLCIIWSEMWEAKPLGACFHFNGPH